MGSYIQHNQYYQILKELFVSAFINGILTVYVSGANQSGEQPRISVRLIQDNISGKFFDFRYSHNYLMSSAEAVSKKYKALFSAGTRRFCNIYLIRVIVPFMTTDLFSMVIPSK